MFWTLLKHYFLEQWRNKLWSQGIWMRILMLFIMLYFMGIFLLLGIVMPDILEEIAPDKAPIQTFCSYIFIYFLVDLLIRMMAQEFPEMKIQHYLLLSISKFTLFRYLMTRAVLNFFSILPLFLIIPVFIRLVIPNFSIWASLAWIVGLIAMIKGNTFLVYYLRRQVGRNWKISLSFLIGVVAILALDHYEFLPVKAFSESLFHGTLLYLWPVIIPIVYAGLSGLILLREFYQTAYFEIQSDADSQIDNQQFNFLTKYGVVGELMRLDLKLIWRNKRPRVTILMMIPFVLFYGLIFYPQEMYQNDFWYLFLAVFLTGVMGMNYAQFLLSWESSFYETLMVRNISMHDFFRSKYLLYVVSGVLCFLMALPYLYFDIRILYFNLAALFFNCGFTFLIYLYFSNYNTKALDLGKRSAFSTGGTSGRHFLIMTPILGLPYLIFAPFFVFGIPHWGLAAIAFFGLLGIALSGLVIKWAVELNHERKHKIVESFRNDRS